MDGTNEQGIDVWARKLKVDVLNNAVAGVDCAVVTKIEASGGDIEELLPPSPSKSGKKKDPRDSKNGGRNSKADDKKKSLEERKSASAALRESRRSSTILGNMVRRMSRSSVPAQEADGEGEEEVPDWIAEEREQDRAKARASGKGEGSKGGEDGWRQVTVLQSYVQTEGTCASKLVWVASLWQSLRALAL